MSNISKEEKQSMQKKRIIKDKIYNSFTYIASTFGLVTLIAIIVFVMSKGSGLLNIGLLTSDYNIKVYNLYTEEDVQFCNCDAPENLEEGSFYSPKWGIALKDDKNREGHSVIKVVYINENSPLTNLANKNATDEEDAYIKVTPGYLVNSIIFTNKDFAFTKNGAQIMIDKFENADGIKEFSIENLGGGIRGSLITTFYLIGLTLAIALPVGILTAIYLSEYAPKNVLTNFLRSLIEMLTGVPSIIFGLMGAAVFIPLTTKYLGASGGNIISGSMTLAVILLPIIIRSTEEALKVVPKDFRSASLALGANHTQTTFKVVLPSAFPGILTATILSIGRIIGESAALIYAIGTAIKDNVILTERSTSLAVHIWSVMKGAETPNIELACTISIIILFTVLVLNILVKLISNKLNKAWY